MTKEIKLGIKSVLEQRKEYDALNYINELENENEELNDFQNSQLAKVLKENAQLKEYVTMLSFLDEQNKKEIEKLNDYIKARFVLCNTCTDEGRRFCKTN